MKFLFNIALALLWCALTGLFSEWNFLAGFLVGALVISIYGHATGASPYIRGAWRRLRFLLYFTRILVISNLKVAWEVLTPSMRQTPRIIRYPVEDMTPAQRAILASTITLTPGTLAMDISPNGKHLYIHCMYAEDRDQAVRDLDEVATKLKESMFT